MYFVDVKYRGDFAVRSVIEVMAAVYKSVYYDCLQKLKEDITTGITQTDVKVDRLTEKAKKKGLLPSGYSVRPDSKPCHSVSRESQVASLVSVFIESVKRNGNLFHSFLALLEDVGLHALVGRIRSTLEQGNDRKQKAPPPLSCDSGVSVTLPSVGANSPSLTPKAPMLLLSEGQTSATLPLRARKIPTQSGNSTVKKQMDRSRRTRSLYDERAERIETPTESFSSPTLNDDSSTLPMQETQEDQRRVMVVPDSHPKLSLEDHRNVLLEMKHADAQSKALREQTQQLKKDKATLQKLLEEKEKEIENLQLAQKEADKKNEEQIKNLKEKVCKD